MVDLPIPREGREPGSRAPCLWRRQCHRTPPSTSSPSESRRSSSRRGVGCCWSGAGPQSFPAAEGKRGGLPCETYPLNLLGVFLSFWYMPVMCTQCASYTPRPIRTKFSVWVLCVLVTQSREYKYKCSTYDFLYPRNHVRTWCIQNQSEKCE